MSRPLDHIASGDLANLAESLRERLRRETSAAHAALDEALARSGSFASRRAYAGFLRGFLLFQSAAEAELTAGGAARVIEDWPQRCRAHLLRRDLEALDANDDSAHAMHGIDVQPGPRTPEHILGTAYVLEGSTLGGAVLLKALAPLGITATNGGAFLASYGAERGRMWQGFLATLAAWEARGIRNAAVIFAAHRAFDAARQALLPSAECGPRGLSGSERALPPASA